MPLPKPTKRPAGKQARPPFPWRGLIIGMGSVGLALGLYIVYGMSDTLSLPVRESTAALTGLVYRAFGGDADVISSTILVGNFRFLVVNDCTPVGVVLLVWGAVLASPVGWRAKAIGLAIGGLFLPVLNLVRLVSLVFLGVRVPQHLETVHLLIWQPAMVLAAIVMWLVWLERSSRVRTA